jgi:hypothetical protein
LSCFNDDFDRAIGIEAIPLIAFVPVESSPVPGNNGIITTGVVGASSIQLTWTRATDGETPQEDLAYRVYRSDYNDIRTPGEAEANGYPVTGWEQDRVAAVAEGLDPGTNYYFNVLVRDGDGLMAAYITVSATTLSDAVYLFSAGLFTGDLVNYTPGSSEKTMTTLAVVPVRDMIDDLCAYARDQDYPTLPCLNVRAFISVSSDDEIADMPGLYGIPTTRRVIGPGGERIAADWWDLFDGSIEMTLAQAGIAGESWWSGSDDEGRYMDGHSCDGWTGGYNTSSGMSGVQNQTDFRWIEFNDRNCNNPLALLCACW